MKVKIRRKSFLLKVMLNSSGPTSMALWNAKKHKSNNLLPPTKQPLRYPRLCIVETFRGFTGHTSYQNREYE